MAEPTDLPNLSECVLEFVRAHRAFVDLLDAVVQTPYCLPTGWEHVASYLDTLHRRRHDVAAFLIKYGPGGPHAAWQTVTALLDACERARRKIEGVGLAYLNLPAMRDDVANTAEPVYVAMRLYLEELKAQANGAGGGPAADVAAGGPAEATPPAATEADEQEPGPDAPTVDDEDENILRTLKKAHPRRLTQDQIEARSHPRLSRRTVSDRMKCLLRDGLVTYPNGPKKGATITKAGLSLLRGLDGAKPAQ
jgi:hypothetical protein